MLNWGIHPLNVKLWNTPSMLNLKEQKLHGDDDHLSNVELQNNITNKNLAALYYILCFKCS